MRQVQCKKCGRIVTEGDVATPCEWVRQGQPENCGLYVPNPPPQQGQGPGSILSSKEIVCPKCYRAHRLILQTNPRVPAPTMMWLCDECHELSVFDDNLDLREATDVEKARAIKPTMAR